MGFFKTVGELYATVKAAHPRWDDERIRAEMERYLSGALRPLLSGKDLYDFFNDANAQADSEGAPLRNMPQYSSLERRERRERASIVRQSVIDIAVSQGSVSRGYKYKLNEGGIDPNTLDPSDEQKLRIEADARRYDVRMEQRLFYYISPTASEQERDALKRENDEIAFLFDTNKDHWEQYYSENVAMLKNSRDASFANMSDDEIRAELEKGIRERRGEVLMKRAHIAGALVDKIEAMSDPALPAEELAANYSILAQQQYICMEALSFLEEAEKGRYILSDEDKDYLRYIDKYQVPMANAATRIAAWCNPICEFVDPEYLITRDCDELSDDYLVDYNNHRTQMEQKHSHYKQYVDKEVEDQALSLLNDVCKISADTAAEIDHGYENTVKEYGFTLGQDGATIRCEQYNGEKGFVWKLNAGVKELKAGRPIVVEQNGRVAVLCQRYPFSCELVWDKPEKLFNYSLRCSNEMLRKQLGDSDQWYQTRSKKFKELRHFFEELADSARELDDTAKSQEEVRQDYEKLVRLCDVYLDTKPRSGVGKNTLEQGHIDVAKALKNHATMKLSELDKVQKARKELEKYRGMTKAEIKASIDRKTKYRMDLQRRNDLKSWIIGQRDAYSAMNLPESLTNAIVNASRSLIANTVMDYTNQAAQSSIHISNATRNNVNKLVGSMIVAEMIQTERETLRNRGRNENGPLEQSFAENAYGDQELCALGEAAAKEVTGMSVSQMNQQQMSDYVATFPASGLARDLQAAIDLKLSAENAMKNREKAAEVDTMRGTMQYFSKNGFGLLGTFANENILSKIEKLSTDINNDIKMTDLAASRELMKNCVIYCMISELGDDNTAKMMSILRDPQKTEELKASMDGAESFQKLMGPLEAAEKDGKIPISAVSSAFNQMKPQRTALVILQDTKFKTIIKAGSRGSALELPQKINVVKTV